MRATSITDNLIQLTQLRLVNAYLVREDDGFTLIDAMLPRSGGGIIAAAQSVGVPIRRVTFTHAHGDHVGSLDELTGKLGAEVEYSMSDTDARLLAGEKLVEGKLTGQWPKVKHVPGRHLQPGDRVGSLEVIDAPGHTPGHVAFLDTRDRSLIAGDVYTTVGGIAVTSHFYWKFPLPASATYDKPRDLQSARDLRALDPTVLALGHGPALRNPAAKMDAAIAAAS